MTISMYQASVPVLVRALGNLRALLEKGAAHAEARKFDAAALINSRLAPDMFPLSRQVQIATDMSKGAVARLAGAEIPKYEDNEATFADLIARLDKTIAFIKGFKAEQFEGSENKDIVLQTRNGNLDFKGLPYLQFFVLPNVYFHVTTAYNLLRHNGVEVGKQDFIGKP